MTTSRPILRLKMTWEAISGLFKEEFCRFSKEFVIAGRDKSCDIIVPLSDVLPLHLMIFFKGDSYFFEAFEKGVFLNDEGVTPHQSVLWDFFVPLRIGPVTLERLPEFPKEKEITASESLARLIMTDILLSFQIKENETYLETLSDKGRGERVFIPLSAEYLIGSAAMCDIVLSSPDVPAHGAVIQREVMGIRLKLLAQGEKIEINHRPAYGIRILEDGDVIQFFDTRFLLNDPVSRYMKTLWGTESEHWETTTQISSLPMIKIKTLFQVIGIIVTALIIGWVLYQILY